MKPRIRTLLLLALVCVLPACGKSSHGEAKSYRHYAAGDGAIDLRHDEVLIRAGGQPEDARIAADGSLHLGERSIEVSAAGRAALAQYYADTVAYREHLIAFAATATNFGIHTAQSVLKGLFDGTADAAGRRADRQGADLEKRASELCARYRATYTSQQAAAAAVPAFQPYAVIAARQVDDCDKDQDQNDEGDDDDKSEDGDDEKKDRQPSAGHTDT